MVTSRTVSLLTQHGGTSQSIDMLIQTERNATVLIGVLCKATVFAGAANFMVRIWFAARARVCSRTVEIYTAAVAQRENTKIWIDR